MLTELGETLFLLGGTKTQKLNGNHLIPKYLNDDFDFVLETIREGCVLVHKIRYQKTKICTFYESGLFVGINCDREFYFLFGRERLLRESD